MFFVVCVYFHCLVNVLGLYYFSSRSNNDFRYFLCSLSPLFYINYFLVLSVNTMLLKFCSNVRGNITFLRSISHLDLYTTAKTYDRLLVWYCHCLRCHPGTVRSLLSLSNLNNGT